MEKDAVAEEMDEINGVTWWSKAGKGPQGAKWNGVCGHGKEMLSEEVLGFFQAYRV